jgi:hypothetical protein
MDFTIDLSAEAGFSTQGNFSLIVGQMPILVIDLDENQNSADDIMTAIEGVGLGADYIATWPEPGNIGLYSSIFLCLGVYPTNGELTISQGTELSTFLNEGGRLYMEGGDTWYYDEQTPVHAKFNINALDDGSGDMDVLQGQAGTFTQGMSFNYAGDNSWMDHIEAIAPAFNIFENNAPAYFSGVAYDAGTYKTIGCAHEFGGLVNGTGVSTQLQLMQEYLDFFGISKIKIAPDQPSGNEQVCQNSQVQYTTNAVAGADMYFWSIEPETAGIVTGSDTAVLVQWDQEYLGMAYLRVCAINSIGAGPTSDSLAVLITASPTAIMTGSVDMCMEGQAELVVDLTGTAPWQLIIKGDAYTANATPFTFTVSPSSNTSYSVSSVSDATNCSNTGEGATDVIIIDVPAQAAIPTGPAQVNTNDTPESIYSTTGAPDASTYSWEITPSEVYVSLEVNGNECTVTWSGNYNGPATVDVRVSGVNDCGSGEPSDAFSVEMQNVGIDEMKDAYGITLYPNPNKGVFTLEIAKPLVGKVNLRILNANGHTVFAQKDMVVRENFSASFDISSEAEGIYLILLESDQALYTQKIILQK